MDIEINFLNDWAEYQRGEIIAAGYTIDVDDSPTDLSYKFFNILKRNVTTTPRTVHESSTLVCPNEHQSAYDALKIKFSRGDDVTPHLSKSILDKNYEDALLNDWGIHHFHLGENVDGRFVERTSLLLFALVKNSDVYCIDIKEHGTWSDQSLIRILHDEWSDIISNHRLEGVLGVSHPPSNDTIAEFRRHGVQSVVEVDGVFYGPIGGGYTSARTSLRSNMQVMKYGKIIRDIEKDVKENSDMYVKKIKEFGFSLGDKPIFKLIVDDYGIYVVEMVTRAAFLMYQHNQGQG